IGVRPSTAGRIWFNGVETTHATPGQIMKMGMGYIPQDRINEGLVPDFTIEENLVLGVEEDLRFSKGAFMDSRAVRAFAEECIRAFDIATPGPDQITRLLSGGNLQKVIIARELSMQPRCLIANQPTRGLDVGAIEYIHCQIVAQRDRGAGVLLISEDLEEIFNLSDRIAVMFKGQIMGIFDVKQISLEEVGLLMAGVQREGA
ncbi:MAG: ATP-binding cassette domain-containing protein, partial [Anaerolineaceae bacterium]